jgi:hypothetical protein
LLVDLLGNCSMPASQVFLQTVQQLQANQTPPAARMPTVQTWANRVSEIRRVAIELAQRIK